MRRGGERRADLLAFRLRGDVAQNPFVEEGLRIHVPPRSGTVTLSGAVRRPGEYEIGSTPSLRELLALVGGPSQTAALDDARLTRVGTGERREATALDLRAALTPAGDLSLQPGDAIYVPSTSSLQDVIEVRGAFNGTAESTKTTTAGKQTILQRLELAQGERVRDVLDRAGGATAYADLRLAVVDRSGTTGPRQRIPIDLYRMLVDKDDAPNIVLQNGDVFMLPIVEDKIFILGEVRTPGAHEFRPDLPPRQDLCDGRRAAARAGCGGHGPGGRGQVVAGLPHDPDGGRDFGHGVHRALLHLQRPGQQQLSHVRIVLGARRTALRQFPESEVLLYVARARGGAGPAGLHGAPPQRLRDAHRRVRLRQDHAVARAHPASGGGAVRGRTAHQPELDPCRLPARSPLPARGRDAGDAQARAPAPAQRPVLPQLPGRT